MQLLGSLLLGSCQGRLAGCCCADLLARKCMYSGKGVHLVQLLGGLLLRSCQGLLVGCSRLCLLGRMHLARVKVHARVGKGVEVQVNLHLPDSAVSWKAPGPDLLSDSSSSIDPNSVAHAALPVVAGLCTIRLASTVQHGAAAQHTSETDTH